jgi:dUTP pyrophosphatase
MFANTPSAASALDVAVSRVREGVPLPSLAHPGDAGLDLVTTCDLRLAPGDRTVVGTGIAIALPEGYAGFVHPRSGLAARAGLSVVNAPGLIDAGYRGEIQVCLINHDPRIPLRLERGERIAQLVVQRVERVRFREVADVARAAPSKRGARGYGSSDEQCVTTPSTAVSEDC